MKNKLPVKLFLLLGIMFSISACDKDDPIVSECDDPQNLISPEQDRHFQNIGCIVFWKDGSHAKDLTVKMEIHKEYCNGNTAGHYVVDDPNRLTSSGGNWFSWYNAIYTYKNVKDKVLVRFTIAPGSLDYKYDFVYRWEDVDQDVSGVVANNHLVIDLPINE